MEGHEPRRLSRRCMRACNTARSVFMANEEGDREEGDSLTVVVVL